jgi:hypothetical protein
VNLSDRSEKVAAAQLQQDLSQKSLQLLSDSQKSFPSGDGLHDQSMQQFSSFLDQKSKEVGWQLWDKMQPQISSLQNSLSDKLMLKEVDQRDTHGRFVIAQGVSDAIGSMGSDPQHYDIALASVQQSNDALRSFYSNEFQYAKAASENIQSLNAAWCFATLSNDNSPDGRTLLQSSQQFHSLPQKLQKSILKDSEYKWSLAQKFQQLHLTDEALAQKLSTQHTLASFTQSFKDGQGSLDMLATLRNLYTSGQISQESFIQTQNSCFKSLNDHWQSSQHSEKILHDVQSGLPNLASSQEEQELALFLLQRYAQQNPDEYIGCSAISQTLLSFPFTHPIVGASDLIRRDAMHSDRIDVIQDAVALYQQCLNDSRLSSVFLSGLTPKDHVFLSKLSLNPNMTDDQIASEQKRFNDGLPPNLLEAYRKDLIHRSPDQDWRLSVAQQLVSDSPSLASIPHPDLILLAEEHFPTFLAQSNNRDVEARRAFSHFCLQQFPETKINGISERHRVSPEAITGLDALATSSFLHQSFQKTLEQEGLHKVLKVSFDSRNGKTKLHFDTEVAKNFLSTLGSGTSSSLKNGIRLPPLYSKVPSIWGQKGSSLTIPMLEWKGSVPIYWNISATGRNSCIIEPTIEFLDRSGNLQDRLPIYLPSGQSLKIFLSKP